MFRSALYDFLWVTEGGTIFVVPVKVALEDFLCCTGFGLRSGDSGVEGPEMKVWKLTFEFEKSLDGYRDLKSLVSGMDFRERMLVSII